MQNMPITYEDIISIIKRLLMVAEEYNEPFGEPIVMVGGTAMTAHRIRKQSFDMGASRLTPRFCTLIFYLIQICYGRLVLLHSMY